MEERDNRKEKELKLTFKKLWTVILIRQRKNAGDICKTTTNKLKMHSKNCSDWNGCDGFGSSNAWINLFDS